jgi:hypothetical protein
MYETGHSLTGRDELRQALAMLEAALTRYGHPGPSDGPADAPHRALSQAVQMMRQEAATLRRALASL